MKQDMKKLRKIQIEILDEIVNVCNKHNLKYFLTAGTLLGTVRHKGYIPWDDDLDISMTRDDYNKFFKVFEKESSKEYILDSFSNNEKYWLMFGKVRKVDTIYREKIQENYDGPLGVWVDIIPMDNTDYNYVNLNEKEKIGRIDVLKERFATSQNMSENKNRLEKESPKKIYSLLIKEACENKDEDSKYLACYSLPYGPRSKVYLREKIFPTIEGEFEGKKYMIPNDYKYVLRKMYGEDYMQLPPVEKRKTHPPIEIKY